MAEQKSPQFDIDDDVSEENKSKLRRLHAIIVRNPGRTLRLLSEPPVSAGDRLRKALVEFGTSKEVAGSYGFDANTESAIRGNERMKDLLDRRAAGGSEDSLESMNQQTRKLRLELFIKQVMEASDTAEVVALPETGMTNPMDEAPTIAPNDNGQISA